MDYDALKVTKAYRLPLTEAVRFYAELTKKFQNPSVHFHDGVITLSLEGTPFNSLLKQLRSVNLSRNHCVEVISGKEGEVKFKIAEVARRSFWPFSCRSPRPSQVG